MHLRFLGSSVSQKADATRSGVLLGMIVPLPAGQPRFAGTSRRITADMHFRHSMPSESGGVDASLLHLPRPPRFPACATAHHESTSITTQAPRLERRAPWQVVIVPAVKFCRVS